MIASNPTSIEQLESMRREGRISQDEYARLREALAPRPPEERDARDYKRLRKSWSDRELGGVCGGIARYFDIGSTRVRVLFLLLLLFTGGTAILLYLALYVVLPWDEAERDRVLQFPWKYALAAFLLTVANLGLLLFVVPRIAQLSENLGGPLPMPVRLLIEWSGWMEGGAGPPREFSVFPIALGVLLLIGAGAALSRHPRAYNIVLRAVIGLLVVLLTLQVLTLAFFLLTVASPIT